MRKWKTILLSFLTTIALLVTAVFFLHKQGTSIRGRLRTEYPINLEY